jgi:hypothetical protein
MGIFDEFVQGINREISKVQNRSQEMLQTYNLNSRIRTLEGKRTASMIEIGRLVFEKYERGNDVSEETLKQKTREIVEMEHEITSIKAELDILAAQSDPDTSASQKAEYQAGYKTTPGFECPHCHAPASRDRSFCPACGGNLKEEGSGNGGGGTGSQAGG